MTRKFVYSFVAFTWAAGLLFSCFVSPIYGEEPTTDWIAATDQSMVQRHGKWSVDRFRNAAASHLRTTTDGAGLELRFRGTGIVLRLGNHAVPAYGVPNLGTIVTTLDGKKLATIEPRASSREIVIERGLNDGEHTLRVGHRRNGSQAGCRIEGFRILRRPTGDLQVNVSGEENAFLVDVRAVLRQGDRIVRNALTRNWLTGKCSLAGLPPGDDYVLDIIAAGWKSARVVGISIRPLQSTRLAPIFLQRDASTRIVRFQFPALNRPVVRTPGETFRARFWGFFAKIDSVVLRQQIGPAVVSRRLDFEEDKAAAFYYDREVIAKLPQDIPPGSYDLTVKVIRADGTVVCRSPQSVQVMASYPTDPVFVTWGHLDTLGQFQAEYVERLAKMVNIIAPDMLLVSNAVNPAYISGALSHLEMPYVINFGNHQFNGHEKWFGDPVGLTDLGPDVCILNFGHPWHADLSKANALLSSRNADCKVINAFEHNAPVSFFDKHHIRLIHDAHGPGEKVMDIGATPTRRVGKMNSSSFRVVRFRDRRVVSCTYKNHKDAPIPLERTQIPPLRVAYLPGNEGTSRTVTATLTNEYEDAFPRCRVTFILPRGKYRADHGRIESQFDSDDGTFTVVKVRYDVAAQQTISITISPNEPK